MPSNDVITKEVRQFVELVTIKEPSEIRYSQFTVVIFVDHKEPRVSPCAEYGIKAASGATRFYS